MTQTLDKSLYVTYNIVTKCDLCQQIYGGKREMKAEERVRERRAYLAGRMMFTQARRRYIKLLADKFADGEATLAIWSMFGNATRLALTAFNFKTARDAVLEGYAQAVNELAEQILAVLVGERIG